MTIWPSGSIISKQLGNMVVPIFDAPYTIPNTIGCNCPTINLGLRFAECSPWPVLWNETVNEASPTGYFFPTKINAAIPGILAPTLIATGYQDGLRGQYTSGAGQNGIKYAPCYYGGFLGFNNSFFASQFTFGSIPAPPGVGSVNYPSLKLITTTDSQAIPSSCQTMVCNYQGQTCFCIQYRNGANTQMKFLVWTIGGKFVSEVFTTAGPFLDGGGGSLAEFNPIALMPFTGTIQVGSTYYNVANIALVARVSGGITQRCIMFFDRNLNCLFIRTVQLDNATYQSGFIGAGGNGTSVNIKITTGGYIVSWTTAFPSTVPWIRIFLAADGSYWCPITISMRGTQAQKQADLFDRADLAIDPTGVAWFMQFLSTDTSKIYIGNSFGVNLQAPIPPPFNIQNLPPFNLPCFTPCDIVSAK